MAATTVIGALLIILGLLYTAFVTVYRGRMSEPHSPQEPTGPTLEPRESGLRSFGLKSNWPGLLIIVLGAVILLLPVVFGPSAGVPPP
ncbi:MAG: hypothetical protein JWN11_1867 [Hyphomicrobiales bacterium]|nr:hypothetical protein [Hyphomicrobiales bacterium]